MKTRQVARIGIAVVCAIAAAVSSGWAQGSLTPPGAPAPAMKTLAQVEPRIPIAAVPYTITEPGSYYLATNLVSTGHGIVVQASNVTLDLMGFTLTGDRGSGVYGIWLNGATNAALSDIVVRGGMVRGFEDGLRLDYAQNNRVEGLTISSNANHGLVLNGTSGGTCDGNTVRDCAIRGNDASGVYLEADGGACDGNTIADCAISGNGAFGVSLRGPYGGQCDGNTIAGCAISGNGNYGVGLYGVVGGTCNGNTVRDCAIRGNGGCGVAFAGYGGDCGGNTVARCVLHKNTGIGIYAEDTRGNRIENNHVFGTTGYPSYGIRTVTSSANLILQNTCVGQTNNYAISANDTCGPVVTDSGALATSGAAAHPWANFSR